MMNITIERGESQVTIWGMAAERPYRCVKAPDAKWVGSVVVKVGHNPNGNVHLLYLGDRDLPRVWLLHDKNWLFEPVKDAYVVRFDPL